jgi:hypothetical protein
MSSANDADSQEVASPLKKLKCDDLDTFLDWCEKVEIKVNFDKVTITQKGTSHGYGMVAVADIEPEEILAKIPKKSILDPVTTEIKNEIAKSKALLKSKSKWSKLILSIMFELDNPNSKWSTYLNLFCKKSNFDLPMFWET